MGKSILVSLLLLSSTTSFSQVVYGTDEKDYVQYTHPEYIVDHRMAQDSHDQQLTRYHLSGIGDNWFFTVQGGASFFYGTPSGCGDLFDRIEPSLSLSLGKWHSPYFGTRINYQGFQFKDGNLDTRDLLSLHGDLMFNIASFFHRSMFQSGPKWNVSPYIGGGLLRNVSENRNRFALAFGLNCSYKVSERVNVSAEYGCQLARKDFDGYGVGNHLSDGLHTLSVGVSVNIGKTGWKPKDIVYTDRYVVNDDSFGDTYQKNNYSGLNSLRDRLGNIADSVAPYGTPVLFFFKINTTKLIDRQQLHNIYEIAKAVKDYDLKVHIVGSADSHTGTKKFNRELSIRRCKYIAKLLLKAGVPKSKMTGASLGGVNMYSPYPSNRHTCVIVYKNHYKGTGYGPDDR